MASTFSLLSEKHFLCSLCEDIFSSPVTTPCGHSFCKVCLRKYWSRSGSGKCPFCSKAFVSKPHLSVNRILADVTEHYRRSRLDGKAKSVSVGGLLNEPVGSPWVCRVLNWWMILILNEMSCGFIVSIENVCPGGENSRGGGAHD